MAIKITDARNTEVQGVQSRSIEGEKYSWATPGLAWSDQIIVVNGHAFIAAAIVAAIQNDQPRMAAIGHRTVKFGPGARRIYIEITERLIDAIVAHNEVKYTRDAKVKYPRNAKEAARAQEIIDFATALIDLL